MKYPVPLTNYDIGRGAYKPEAIVLHIMQGTLKGTTSWFQGENNANGVYSSSHIGIGKGGELAEYVEPYDTAYHAGRVSQPTWAGIKKNIWGGFINPNSYTLGIECEGFRGDVWTEEQMTTVCKKVKEWTDQYGIPLTRQNIISHNEIAIDKEDLRGWCDEVIRRLKTPKSQPQNSKQELVALLEKALLVAKNI